MWTRPTDLESWGRYIERAAKNFRSFSQPQPPCPSIGWMYHHLLPRHNCWQTLMTPLGIVGGISCLVPSVVPTCGQACTWTWQSASSAAQSANKTNCLRYPKKNYIVWTKVAYHLSDGALTQQDHFPRTKIEIVTFLLPWIHSPSGWRSMLCPCCIAGGQPSSSMMTWLPVGASHAMSGPIMAPSLWAALYGSVKGWASSITTSPVATVRPTGR